MNLKGFLEGCGVNLLVPNLISPILEVLEK
jgi:hypothetical protein